MTLIEASVNPDRMAMIIADLKYISLINSLLGLDL